MIYYVSNSEGVRPKIYLDSKSHDGEKEDYLFSQSGEVGKVPGASIYTHKFALRNLTPNSPYYFVIGDEKNGYLRELRFMTMPDDETPIEFIQGGDVSTSPNAERIIRNTIGLNTRVLLIGGDIAYANGVLSNHTRWKTWFNRMESGTMNQNGFMVPMILAIGNHETNTESFSDPLKKAPFYFSLFQQNALEANFARRLGSQTVLFVLDSGHMRYHQNQVAWLDQSMSDYSRVKNKLAMYHSPLYPTHRSYEGGAAKRGREHWGPLFDKHKLTFAFENHDHTLKRTKPLFANAVAEEGTIYLGEGCWGVGTREINRRWYHEVAESKRHIWRVNVSPSNIKAEALGEDGGTLDLFELAR